MREVDPAFGHWLAGFIDGEGSFTIQRRIFRSGAPPSYYPRFGLGLRDDDLPVLVEIRDRLAIGDIRDHRQQGRWNPCARFTVETKRDLARLVVILDAHPLRAKKRRDYNIWRRAVRVHARLERGGRADQWAQMQLAQLRTQLKSVRAYTEQPQVGPAPVVTDGQLTLWPGAA
jgi:hypothetical protein